MSKYLTNQEIFDKVLTHLVKQGRPARNEDGCVYRTVTPKGEVLKCAVGCLIPDEAYDKKIEGKRVYALLREHTAVTLSAMLSMQSQGLLESLQEAHDSWKGETDELLRDMKLIARNFKLTFNAESVQ